MALLRTAWVAVVCLSLSVHASPIDVSRRYPFKFYSRAEWLAAPSTDNRPLNLPVPYVVVHHTYIPGACNTTAQCIHSMRGMQNYHISKDWGDIGYNFCLGSEGGAYEGRGWDHVGIHAGPANKYSIGICLIGDWTVELPPQSQLDTLKALIKAGVEMGKVSPDYKLIGHNQAMNTECPGKALFAEITTWDHFVAGKPEFSSLSASTTTEASNRLIFKD